MSSDRMTEATSYLKAALRLLNKNNHNDPLRALRTTLDAHGYLTDAAKILNIEAEQLRLIIDQQVTNLSRGTAHERAD